MTEPTPLPIDISALLDPLPDPAHENLRSHVVSAMQVVWINHLSLVEELADTRAALEALTDRVSALEPAPPVPEPDPAP